MVSHEICGLPSTCQVQRSVVCPAQTRFCRLFHSSRQIPLYHLHPSPYLSSIQGCFTSFYIYILGSKIFRPDQLFKVTELKQLRYFSTQSPFISTHFSTDTLTSLQMALYSPHSIFHLVRLLYGRPETFRPYCVFYCSGLVLENRK